MTNEPPDAVRVGGSFVRVPPDRREAGAAGYFAYSTKRVSRVTVTLI